MRRIPFVAAVLAAVAVPSFAQPPVEPKDGKVVYHLALSPAAVRKPLSRDYLLPEYRESIPGNKVQMFLRCFMEQDSFFGREESLKRQKWGELPIDHPELKDLKDYGNRLLERDMYDAARMLQVDWQLWFFVRRDGYNTLLPDLQKFRALADVLKIRARGQIANRNFDGAIHTLKTMVALSTTMSQHPTLIGTLVGVAIATIAINTVEEFVAQPGAPNLFWATTDLPQPFFDLRYSSSGERMFISHDFEKLTGATGALTDQELERTIKDIDTMMQVLAPMVANKGDGKAPKAKPAPREFYTSWAKDPKRVAAARDRLLGSGFKSDIVRSMPPLQAILTDDIRRYEVLRDESFKTTSLPLWQIKQYEADSKPAKLTPDDGLLADGVIGREFAASIDKVKNAQTRLDQRICYLRIIEAIRLYANEHEGKLPEKLADVKLPLPIDPFTGVAFEYAVQDGIATLHGANPQKDNDKLNRYYELTIRK